MMIASIPKNKFLSFLDDFTQCRISIESKMTEYQDNFFDSLHKLIRSVSFLSELPNESIRDLVLSLKRKPALSHSVIINVREICDKTYFILSGLVWVSVVDPKTGKKFPFQYLKEGSSFNFINWLLQYESLFLFEATSYWVLYVLESEELKKVSNNDHIIKNLLWHIEAKYYVCGFKYDYYVATKYGSSKWVKSKNMVVPLVQNLDDDSPDKLDSNKNSDDKINKLNTEQIEDSLGPYKARMDFKTFLNNETLAPSINQTRNIANTPSTRGKKNRYRQILRKAHQMRFQLIQKIKDGKILFKIVDEYFKVRAEKNALRSIWNDEITKYNIMKMYEIFEPQPADLMSDIGSPRTMDGFEFLTPRSNSR